MIILIIAIVIAGIILAAILGQPNVITTYNYKCLFCGWTIRDQKEKRTDPFCPNCGRNDQGKTKNQIIFGNTCGGCKYFEQGENCSFCGHPDQSNKDYKQYLYYNFSCSLHEPGIAQSRIGYMKTIECTCGHCNHK